MMKKVFLFIVISYSVAATEIDFIIPIPSMVSYNYKKLNETSFVGNLDYRHGLKRGGYLSTGISQLTDTNPESAFTEKSAFLGYSTDPFRDWSGSVRASYGRVDNDYSKPSFDLSLSYSGKYLTTIFLLNGVRRNLLLETNILTTSLEQPYINSQIGTLIFDVAFIYPFSLTFSLSKSRHSYFNFTDTTSSLLTNISFNEYTLLSDESKSVSAGYTWRFITTELIYSSSMSTYDGTESSNAIAFFDIKIKNHTHCNFEIGQDSSFGIGLSYDWY
jgi:hypothetical protein